MCVCERGNYQKYSYSIYIIKQGGRKGLRAGLYLLHTHRGCHAYPVRITVMELM